MIHSLLNNYIIIAKTALQIETSGPSRQGPSPSTAPTLLTLAALARLVSCIVLTKKVILTGTALVPNRPTSLPGGHNFTIHPVIDVQRRSV